MKNEKILYTNKRRSFIQKTDKYASIKVKLGLSRPSVLIEFFSRVLEPTDLSTVEAETSGTGLN